MRQMLACASLLLFSTGAFASGGLSCDSEADSPARIRVESGMTRGMGSPLFNFKGSVVIADAKAPEDLRKVEFEQAHVPQFWIDRNTLNILMYREREGDKPHGYVEISIQTQPRDDEEGTFGGNYELTVWDTTGEGDPLEVKLTGPISCFVE